MDTTITSLGGDRVRVNTAVEVNEQIDEQTARNLRQYGYGSMSEVTHRLNQLEQEWDIERMLTTNAASLVLAGSLLSLFKGRHWLVLPLVVGGFLLQHSVQGWCPPVEVFRRLGFRTRREIERERQALKILRGDYDAADSAAKPDASTAMSMVDR